jgi:hypothetical protein
MPPSRTNHRYHLACIRYRLTFLNSDIRQMDEQIVHLSGAVVVLDSTEPACPQQYSPQLRRR